MYKILAQDPTGKLMITGAENMLSLAECTIIKNSIDSLQPGVIDIEGNRTLGTPQGKSYSAIATVSNLPEVLSARLETVMRDLNQQFYHFDIEWDLGLETYVTITHEGQSAAWHNDLQESAGYARRLILSFQLTPPPVYSGGILEIELSQNQPIFEVPKNLGSVVCFPSYMNHRITEVKGSPRECLIVRAFGMDR